MGKRRVERGNAEQTMYLRVEHQTGLLIKIWYMFSVIAKRHFFIPWSHTGVNSRYHCPSIASKKKIWENSNPSFLILNH